MTCLSRNFATAVPERGARSAVWRHDGMPIPRHRVPIARHIRSIPRVLLAGFSGTPFASIGQGEARWSARLTREAGRET